MSRPGIVIVGPERAGKRTLVAGLQQLNEPPATIATTDGARANVIPIHLETKYYSASLELRLLPAAEFHTPGPASSAALEGAEGLLLVLDATQSFPAGAAERWSELASEASLGCQLCVANKMDAAGESTRAAFYEHAVAWSLDHGFEPVECVATQPAASAQERDKTSVARVLEALQSNMWSNLQRHAAPKPAGGGIAGAGAGAAPRAAAVAGAGAGSSAPSVADAMAARGGFLMSAEEDSDGEAAAEGDAKVGSSSEAGTGEASGFDIAEALEGIDDDDIDGDDDAARALRAALTGAPVSAAEPPSSAGAGADSAATVSAAAADAGADAGAGSDSCAAAASSSTASGAAVAAKPSAAAKGGSKAKKDEAALVRDLDTDFTKMVEEVRRVRDSAKGGQMNDDQRREAAALVTMRLMAMLGGLGDEDEDDDEGGGSAAPTAKGRGTSAPKAAGGGGAGAKKGRK